VAARVVVTRGARAAAVAAKRVRVAAARAMAAVGRAAVARGVVVREAVARARPGCVPQEAQRPRRKF